MSKEIKQEASLPVQSRIDIRSLATVCRYWESEGIYIDTMSKLVSWSIDLLVEILSRNDRLNTVYDSMTEATDYLVVRDLYKPGTGSGKKKAANSRRFESMRLEGVDPKIEATKDYNITHNKNSVEVSDIGSPSKKGTVVFTKEGLANWEADKDREERSKMVAEARARDKEIIKQFKYDENGYVVLPDTPKSEVKAEQFERIIPAESSKPKKGDDRARPMSSEETDAHVDKVLKKDREQLEALKNM